METTTIVVLSVLSTLVIIGLIAMANGLRKAQKEIKMLLESETANALHHDEIHRRIEVECEDIRQDIKREFEDVNRQIQKVIDGVSEQIAQTNRNVNELDNNVHRRIDDTLQKADEQYANISRHTEETWKEWTSDLDRRFDRLYQMIYEAFPQLKK
jgi:ElaB/YqjD/DUF883 family membrane-anchored ribosome-binding protein